MIFDLLKGSLLEILRCPQGPPEPPAGSHDSIQTFRAAPAFLRYRLLTLYGSLVIFAVFEVSAIVAVVAEMGAIGVVFATLILFFAAAKTILLYVTTRLDYEMRFYIITDRSLRIREGVWNIRETTLTYENIQNMRIDQGPLQRLFGIYDLLVETAGGGGDRRSEEKARTDLLHQGAIRGIRQPEQLRDLIMTCLRQTRTTGLGDHDEAAQAPLAPVQSQYEIDTLRAIAGEVSALRQALAQPSA